MLTIILNKFKQKRDMINKNMKKTDQLINKNNYDLENTNQVGGLRESTPLRNNNLNKSITSSMRSSLKSPMRSSLQAQYLDPKESQSKFFVDRSKVINEIDESKGKPFL